MPTIAAPAKSEAIAAARAAVKEAHENHQYWRRQAVVRDNESAKANAAGLRDAWRSTLAARTATLTSLES
jgi:hypothetical protein